MSDTPIGDIPIVLGDLLPVIAAAGALKTVARAGWVRAGVDDPESVADHSYRLAILALVIGPRLGVDQNKLVRLALLHDLPEARTGDVTPVEGKSVVEKHLDEGVAFADLVLRLPERAELLALWQEYQDGATPEARLIHQLDKLEMALQALEYERAQGRNLVHGIEAANRNWGEEFWISARAGLEHPALISLYDQLYRERPLAAR